MSKTFLALRPYIARVWVLSVFKLVFLGPPESWLLDPQSLRSSKCPKLVFGYVTVVIKTNLILFVFNNSEVWRVVNPSRMFKKVYDQHKLIKHLCTSFKRKVRLKRTFRLEVSSIASLKICRINTNWNACRNPHSSKTIDLSQLTRGELQFFLNNSKSEKVL